MQDFKEHLQKLIEEREERLRVDAERFHNLDRDKCQLCGVKGEDKRTFVIRWFYSIHEQVPEAIDEFG